jgi:hypothetical protein
MEFPGDIAALILEQRITLSSTSSSTLIDEELKQLTLQQISHILSYGLSIDIHIFLTCDKCSPTSSTECKSTYLIECWKIQRLKDCEAKVREKKLYQFLRTFIFNAINLFKQV